MIDKELLARKISLISKDLDDLKEIAKKTAKEFLESKVDEVVAERYLERMIGRMIDVNYHIATEMQKPPPRDYFQSFLVLGELKILPADFARKIASSAGLRNRLVHEYDEIDHQKLYEGLQSAIKDIPVYLEHIAELL